MARSLGEITDEVWGLAGPNFGNLNAGQVRQLERLVVEAYEAGLAGREQVPAAAVAARVRRDWLGEGVHADRVHVPEPAPAAVFFGDDGREVARQAIPDPAWHPLLALHCVCGTQLRRETPDAPWEHC